MRRWRFCELDVTSTIVNKKATQMRVCPLLLVLFFATQTPGVATGIDELLGSALVRDAPRDRVTATEL